MKLKRFKLNIKEISLDKFHIDIADPIDVVTLNRFLTVIANAVKKVLKAHPSISNFEIKIRAGALQLFYDSDSKEKSVVGCNYKKLK